MITDNMQVLAMLCTGRSANKLCMSWLGEIFWLCFLWNIDITASYIKSADNLLADALSRVPEGGARVLLFTAQGTKYVLFLIFRTVHSSSKETPKDPSRCCPSRFYQELSSVPT